MSEERKAAKRELKVLRREREQLREFARQLRAGEVSAFNKPESLRRAVLCEVLETCARRPRHTVDPYVILAAMLIALGNDEAAAGLLEAACDGFYLRCIRAERDKFAR